MSVLELSADYIVVGSGPGGAATAYELTKRGKKVLLFEKGSDHRDKFYYGTYLGPLLFCDRASLLFTKEGLNIVRPQMLGGATSMYCGCAAHPPDWLRKSYGANLGPYVDQTIEELGIRALPEALRGKASTRIAEAAGSLGYEWQPVLKFMNPARSKRFQCGANCMIGCACGAKWNAAEYVDAAEEQGLSLFTQADVGKVLFEGDHVRGVAGTIQGRPFSATAPTVVLAAGGIGTPRLLQRSGLKDAGRGMTMDITIMVYGFGREKGIGKEPPMTWYWENAEDGYMLSTLMDPWLLFPLIMALKGIQYPFYWPWWNRALGVMIKLKDDISGGVFPDGSISKPFSAGESERTNRAIELSKKILVQAGASPSHLFVTPQRGTHPSGTVRLGTLLDGDLQTEKRGLYVCDASVFPEALCRPTVLTIIGFAKRLVAHLLGETQQGEAAAGQAAPIPPPTGGNDEQNQP
jgi:choline dehydrogenase-like flavoprotein